MSKEILKRVFALLIKGAREPAQFIEADLDEIRILNSRTRDFFPKEFNKLLDSITYLSASANRNSFERLLRILDVVESLPEEMRMIPNPEHQELNTALLVPLFEIEKNEKSRIFELCSDMRKIVLGATHFDEPHRIRLLNRIAAIEAETQKPKGIFDVVRGGINDLGETLGKFGVDIKPLTDRMAEVVSIARRGTKEYDQLPPPDEVKQLPAPTDEESN